MLVKFFDDYTLNDKRPSSADITQNQTMPSQDLNFTDSERRTNEGSMTGSRRMMLMYLDNSSKFIDLLRRFKDENQIDVKAYENIVDINRNTQFFDAKGNPKPEKILESLTDVRTIIKDFDKDGKKAEKKAQTPIVIAEEEEVELSTSLL